MDLSPFAHSPIVPGPDPDLVGMPVLLLIAVGLLAIGLGAFARRDVVST
jgi:putative exporter of polyketide antibiotics